MSSRSSQPVASISRIASFDDLLRYLEAELDWPVADMAFDDLAFEYDPQQDLGLSIQTSAPVRRVLQLRPLSVEQPFGIFFIEFEQRYLPAGIMRRILAAFVTSKRAGANPASRKTWCQEDLVFVAASGSGDRHRLDFVHFAHEAGRPQPQLRSLGWDPREPESKLLWVEEQLRDHLTWPDSLDPVSWRKQWHRAFSARRGRDPSAWSNLDGGQRALLIDLYSAADLTVDALPYTPDFEWMLDAFNASAHVEFSPHQFWRALSSARKGGHLVRKQR